MNTTAQRRRVCCPEGHFYATAVLNSSTRARYEDQNQRTLVFLRWGGSVSQASPATLVRADSSRRDRAKRAIRAERGGSPRPPHDDHQHPRACINERASLVATVATPSAAADRLIGSRGTTAPKMRRAVPRAPCMCCHQYPVPASSALSPIAIPRRARPLPLTSGGVAGAKRARRPSLDAC